VESGETVTAAGKSEVGKATVFPQADRRMRRIIQDWVSVIFILMFVMYRQVYHDYWKKKASALGLPLCGWRCSGEYNLETGYLIFSGGKPCSKTKRSATS
jgi:hypothetical protein